MNANKLNYIDQLINNNKINDAQKELSKLGIEFLKDPEYLYLRSKIFLKNKLYYMAVDTLLIALEFKENDKIYNLISKIYSILGNEDLSKKIGDVNLRSKTIENLKSELTGISQKGYEV